MFPSYKISLLLTGLQKMHMYETFMSFELEGNYLKDKHKVTWTDTENKKSIKKMKKTFTGEHDAHNPLDFLLLLSTVHNVT